MDQEKRQQRVELRIELEDAESDLARLRKRAIRDAEELEGIAKKVRRNAVPDPSRDDFNVEIELKMRLSVEELNFLKSSGNAITGLIAELKQMRQKVFHLRERDVALTRAAGWKEP